MPLFSQLGVPEDLVRGLDVLGISTPTSIQASAIPYLHRQLPEQRQYYTPTAPDAPRGPDGPASRFVSSNPANAPTSPNSNRNWGSHSRLSIGIRTETTAAFDKGVASSIFMWSTASPIRYSLAALLGACLAGLIGCAQTAATRESDRPLAGYPRQRVALMKGSDTAWASRRIGTKEYFAQPNDWTCSASSYIMVHRSLTGRDIPLSEVVARTGARKGVGAENIRVVEAMKMLGPKYEIISGQSSVHPAGESRIQAAEKDREHVTLTRLLRDGYLVILNFRNPEDHGGHYGVLQGLNDMAIQIADPYYGRVSVMPWKDFDFRSGYSDPVLHGWYVAVRPKP